MLINKEMTRMAMPIKDLERLHPPTGYWWVGFEYNGAEWRMTTHFGSQIKEPLDLVMEWIRDAP